MDGCDSTSGVSQASIFFKTMSHFLYMQFIRMSIRMSSHRRIIFIHHLMVHLPVGQRQKQLRFWSSELHRFIFSEINKEYEWLKFTDNE
ncbi:Hypothetical predicted protein [Podarcis lilfordi]|uniref:Uncharacterized protein n=1 Tax=Podarcis lilfordi TaxID=74358 RepID=A0AA35K3P7_9SAUR|nr:Hypothetical predicted protein [Podarcis lilfordi]